MMIGAPHPGGSAFKSSYLDGHGLPDPSVVEAQIMQESHFNLSEINQENPCNSSAVHPPWSFGALQINRGCNPWFSSNADGSFNDSLWRNPAYYFNATLSTWMRVYQGFEASKPGCSTRVYVDWTVAAWNAGPPPSRYATCSSPPYDPRGYLGSVTHDERVDQVRAPVAVALLLRARN